MSIQPESNPPYFRRFKTAVDGIELPVVFSFPFHYEPHEIALIASRELQTYLHTQTDWHHDFGMEPGNDGEIIGKMFGVLVVKNAAGELGYLCAVSGKLAGQNQHELFVPPVFDILPEDGFFRKGEAVITKINERVTALEQSPDYLQALENLHKATQQSESELASLKQYNQHRKEVRASRRIELEQLNSDQQREEGLKLLGNESISDHYHFKKLKKEWKERLSILEATVAEFHLEIDQLKEERKHRSAALQEEIFDQFHFVNKALEKRSVGSIFKETPEGRPVAGAGECAAPKLFQYAFLNNLEPIALAEFWWGQSPKTEVRIHGHYYPACRGKCEPILGHMLQGLNVEENPLQHNPAEGKELSIVWEDEHLVVINKPHEFLSAPGKRIKDSVLTRLRERYPNATGPLIVHRLDMSTSGLLLAAKSLEIYIELQRQFIQREVKKRYVAVLEGQVERDEGLVDLPLRVDLDDRPRQLVCYEYGKPAQTRWEVIERHAGRTRVHFHPITGRTHQLRVHAAHALGMNHPIVGDELYGRRSTRLHLHAERIEFRHPVSGEWLVVEVGANF
jgi:tRNA pseudouridine32 synthase/23S rRNA pseudouridine746 synthase